MHRFRVPSFLAAAALAALPLTAQDSVSKTGCLPGDAVSPWDAAGAPFGSEQCDAYAVDLSPVLTSWNNVFGVAPLLKSSKTTPGLFHNTLMSSQGMSRTQALGVPFSSSTYGAWTSAPGTGVNGDPSINDPPSTIDKSGAKGHRFGVAFSEFGSSGSGDYNGIVSGVVDVDPTDPGRLWVTKRIAAVNSCNDQSNMSQFGFGSIDHDGNLVFRVDDFGTAAGCGTSKVSGNNAFRVSTVARDCSVINAISLESLIGGGLTDAGATTPIVGAAPFTVNTPGIVPRSATGGPVPLYVGTDFNGFYERGTDISTFVADQSHFAPGVVDQRGNISWSEHDFAFLGSTAGTLAILGFNAANEAVLLNLWGIDGAGNVTGKQAFQLPANVVDNATGFANPGGSSNRFTHYFSQTAFRGGNGQISMGRDGQGRLLVAAAVDHPTGGATNIGQYIAVARVNPSTGNAGWTMAAYNDGLSGGKPILDGPGGSPVGRIIDMPTLTGNVLPGMSAPTIDGAGNVWFTSAVEVFNPGGPSTMTVGLLRAVYDPAAFKYELELVLRGGTVVTGVNSGRQYMITFIPIVDSNSIASQTVFSQNGSGRAHLSAYAPDVSPADTRSLGGLAFNVEILYDWNDDTQFVACTGTGGDPTSPDQDYQVVLYVGAMDPDTDLDGNGVGDEAQMLKADTTQLSVGSGGTVSFEVQAGLENAGNFYMLLGSASGTTPGIPFAGGVVLPLNPDFYFFFTVNRQNLPPFSSTFGVLPANGKANPTFTLPAGLTPAIIGMTLHHAYGVATPQIQVVAASEAWPVNLVP